MYTNVNLIYNKIYFSYFKNSKRIDTHTIFNPELFIPDKNGKYTGDDGNKLRKVIIPLKDYWNVIKEKPNFFYGEINPIYQFINKVWENSQFSSNTFKKFKIYSIDIEVLSNTNQVPDVNEAKFEISSVSIKDFYRNRNYVLSFLKYDKNKSVLNIDKNKIIYKKCENEVHLLQVLVEILNKDKPDILTGWNIEYFDLPYIYNRIERVLGVDYLKKCSYYNVTRKIKIKNYNNIIMFNDPLIPYLDYLSLYKTFTENKSALALNNVCWEELELEKLDYDSNLNDLALNNSQRYVDYNIWDSELVFLLDEKLKLIELALNIMYRSKTIHKDVFHNSQLWDVLIYNELKKEGKEIIPWPEYSEFDRIKGAHVFDTIGGVHENIVVFDINSLYPNIVIGANISKMSLVENVDDKLLHYKRTIEKNIDNIINRRYINLLHDLEEYDYCYTPNGEFWKRDKQSTISRIMEDIYNERLGVQQKKKLSKDENNKNSLDKYQYALKILLNAGYGVFACEWFRYRDSRVGEAITSMGQLIIKSIYTEINKKLKDDVYVIGGDTDSIFLSLTPYINKLNIVNKNDRIQKIIEYSNKEIINLINEIFNRISKQLNFFKSPLKIKLEYIADKGVYRAKKNYVVRKVTDGEKVLEKKKIQPKGIEIIRSSFPFYLRKKIFKYLEYILDDDMELLDKELELLRKEFEEINIENIAFSKTTTDITKYFCSYKDGSKLYEKATPIHIRAAINYNYLVEKHNLNLKKAVDHGRIFYVYMRTPNILNENVMGFVDGVIFDKLNLKQYIDYDMQFEKLILNSLTKLTAFFGKDLVNDKSNRLVDINCLFDKDSTTIKYGNLVIKI